MALLWLYRRYAGAFDEAGLTKDFEKLMGALENLLEARDLIDGMVWVLEAYTVLEDACRRMRKYVPPTILKHFRADIVAILETTP